MQYKVACNNMFPLSVSALFPKAFISIEVKITSEVILLMILILLLRQLAIIIVPGK